MNLPVSDIRTAVHTALSASCTFDVVDIPTPDLTAYVVISAIRLSEDTAQSYPIFNAYVTIDVVKKFQKTGNRSDCDAQAVLVDTAMVGSVTGGITVTGWDRVSMWLDSQDENLSNDADGKTHRIQMSYFIKLCKS